ncbi:uncharacterized protein EI97DRAFT_47306 [Westerdykella ornata]|uniref:Uncharacterized protein n=1 Tax=Westerdykella ornata TaxID=318751 RepID=A0A6A6JIL8_WESOR|nr:uncharacterized protein EI97DRAFT_47306 [Westerdykella ornata]KAF2276064.1 hypothetical protein EI97DRAFT_47306 [Westerdykella ornata]
MLTSLSDVIILCWTLSSDWSETHKDGQMSTRRLDKGLGVLDTAVVSRLTTPSTGMIGSVDTRFICPRISPISTNKQ